MKKIYTFSIFAWSCLWFTGVFGQGDSEAWLKQLMMVERHQFLGKISGQETRNGSDYDLKYHRLEWKVDPSENYISGAVSSIFEVRVEGFSSISFSLSENMSLDSVRYHGYLILGDQIDHTGNTATIGLDEVVPAFSLDSITLYYHGSPVSSGFGSFAIATKCDHPAMWTLSEPFGAQGWWPCKQSLDDKIDSIDVIVTTPSPYKVASNGLLVSNKVEGDKAIFHWKHRYPIPAYLIAIAVSVYEVYSDYVPLPGGGQIEVLNYVYPCHLDNAMASTPFTIDAMTLYDSLYEIYPFYKEKYGHAEFGWGGGMEHQTMGFMGGFGEGLIAHELAHQWFGDKITCGSWQDIWLNEGWATYSEGMTHEAGIRTGSNWKGWLEGRINTITSQPGGSVYIPQEEADNVGRIFNGRLTYSKGAMLLHMLRWKLGDECFFSAVRSYLEDDDLAFDYALTDQFKAHLESVCGVDLTEFFDDWFYGEGYPKYDISWGQNGLKEVHIIVHQTPSDESVDFFDIPIPLYLTDGTLDTTLVLEPSFDGQEFIIPIDFYANEMTFDPDRWVLATSTVTEMPVAVIEQTVNKGYRINPNPVDDVLYLQVEALKNMSIEVSIYDLSGKKVLGQSIEAGQGVSNHHLDVTSIEKGYYTVKILSPQGMSTLTFVKR